jgi:hypothetical protein
MYVDVGCGFQVQVANEFKFVKMSMKRVNEHESCSSGTDLLEEFFCGSVKKATGQSPIYLPPIFFLSSS